jgi:hypothetical protein
MWTLVTQARNKNELCAVRLPRDRWNLGMQSQLDILRQDTMTWKSFGIRVPQQQVRPFPDANKRHLTRTVVLYK